MSIEKHKAFLDSLEPEKGLPVEMHGWRFDDRLSDFEASKMPARPNVKMLSEMIEYLVERCRKCMGEP